MARRRHPPCVGRVKDVAKRAEIIPIMTGGQQSPKTESAMHMNLSLTPLVSLIAGVLILVMPKLLNYIVALYLIVIGLIGLFGTGGELHFR
jgi:hypothetical protein